jgi:hypothetical protein
VAGNVTSGLTTSPAAIVVAAPLIRFERIPADEFPARHPAPGYELDERGKKEMGTESPLGDPDVPTSIEHEVDVHARSAHS